MIGYKKLFLIAFPVGVALVRWLVPEPDRVAAAASWIPWRCPIHLLTGWLCPGCGLSRSTFAFFGGFYEQSFSFHPMGPLFSTALIALWIILLIQVIRNKSEIQRMPNLLTSNGSQKWSGFLLVAVIAFGVIRNLS